MTDSGFSTFEDIIAEFQSQYPNRKIEHRWEIDRYLVYIDGEVKFCTSGFSFLYNLTRLCAALKDELK